MTAVSTLPAQLDLLVYQGDDLGLTITVTNPDGTATNLTGTVTAQIRSAPGAPSVLAAFTVAVAGNVITLTMANSLTLTLPAVAAWDCEWTNAAGNIATLVGGAVKTTPDVTRP